VVDDRPDHFGERRLHDKVEEDAVGVVDGKVALITGSSKGLGRAIALRLASLGADCCINYSREAAPAEEVCSEIGKLGRDAIAIQADVSSPAEIGQLFSAAMDRFGHIDVVVANAGVELVNVDLVDVKEEDFDRLFRVNAKGPFFVLQAAARMIADGGRIINISSSTTVRPQRGESAYGGSKTPAKYFVEVLAKELAGRNVTVNSVIPGPIDQAGIFRDMPRDDPYRKQLIDATPLGRLGLPEDVADVVEFLAGPKASFITGEHILMNGGASF
jgi:3-oxoacyl-[acyl-carrier protein] reductase